jgi:hypothetical protein
MRPHGINHGQQYDHKQRQDDGHPASDPHASRAYERGDRDQDAAQHQQHMHTPSCSSSAVKIPLAKFIGGAFFRPTSHLVVLQPPGKTQHGQRQDDTTGKHEITLSPRGKYRNAKIERRKEKVETGVEELTQSRQDARTQKKEMKEVSHSLRPCVFALISRHSPFTTRWMPPLTNFSPKLITIPSFNPVSRK